MYMQITIIMAVLGLGAASCMAVYFLATGLQPWLHATLISLVAMLPAVVLLVSLQRELERLVGALRSAVENRKPHPVADLRLRQPLLKAMATAVQGLQTDRMSSIRRLAERGSHLAISSARLSHSADTLRDGIQQQVEQAHVIGKTSQQINATTQNMSDTAGAAEAVAKATLAASNEGQHTVAETISKIHQVRGETEKNADTLRQLQERSQEIKGITQIIDQVADQTNLLALNAAIEAARAGEHGRGFAVVADEVRQLASKTSTATREISDKLQRIHNDVNQSAETVEHLVEAVEGAVGNAEQTGSVLQNISSLSAQSETRISEIATAVGSHVSAIDEITNALSQVEHALALTEREVEGVSDGALQLADVAEAEYVCIAEHELDTVHDRMRHVAQDAARRIGELFEQSVNAGRLSREDLMDRDYQAIANTAPQKFTTRFDSFTDRVLPAIQEPILQAHPFAAYAGAVDNNGYFPTHNKRFTQPLTGDHDKDLAHNRTKRIFDDRTGSRCGSNTEPFLLQTYKRDTGEIMHDMSAPIFVFGRHWGGFRIGYGSDAET